MRAYERGERLNHENMDRQRRGDVAETAESFATGLASAWASSHSACQRSASMRMASARPSQARAHLMSRAALSMRIAVSVPP